MSRGITIIPIVLGAGAGALVAVLQSKPPAAPAKAARAQASTTRELRPNAPEPAAVMPPSSASGNIAAVTATPVSPPPLASQAAQPKPGARSAFDLSEPASAEDLLAAQVACNRGVPEACERAAKALTSGNTGTRDPTRARALGRIALTVYVKQCESSRPSACARLAEMYEGGELAQPNPRTASALRARVTELCAQHGDDPACAP